LGCVAGCNGETKGIKEGAEAGKERPGRRGNYEGVARDAWELAESIPEITQPTYFGGYSYGVCLTWYGELTEDAIATIISRLREEKAKCERLQDVALLLRFFKEEVLIDRGQDPSGWKVTERGKEVEYRRVEIE
jgi:hypothetical protein